VLVVVFRLITGDDSVRVLAHQMMLGGGWVVNRGPGARFLARMSKSITRQGIMVRICQC